MHLVYRVNQQCFRLHPWPLLPDSKKINTCTCYFLNTTSICVSSKSVLNILTILSLSSLQELTMFNVYFVTSWPATLKNNKFLRLVITIVPSLTVKRFGPIFFYRVEPDNAKRSIPVHSTFVNGLDLWPMTLKINMVHSVIIGNRCAYFDENTLNSLISIMFTRLFPLVNYDLDLWPPNSIASIFSS